VPLDNVTVPVGVPPVPVTLAVTSRVCPEFNVLDAGVTVTVGVALTNVVTVTVAVPVAVA
jgi:hypothetical protein